MNDDSRIASLEKYTSACNERWKSQKDKDIISTTRQNDMSLRLRSLENWKSNLAGKLTIIAVIAAFLGSLAGTVLSTVVIKAIN